MDRRRRVVILAGTGVARSGLSLALMSETGASTGQPADFCRALPAGVGIVFIIAAVVQFIKWKREEARRDRP